MKFIETVGRKCCPAAPSRSSSPWWPSCSSSWRNPQGWHLIGASVIAMFIGMIVNRFYAPNDKTKPGIKFTSKKTLKFAIILLGASLNITTVLTVGKFSLTVMLFTLATCFGLGYVIGKALGLETRKTSSLINAGTGICGGSAIAAIAPVIEATDMDIAYGMSATFLFDTIMVVVFPLLGRAMGLSDAAFGLWAGTARQRHLERRRHGLRLQRGRRRLCHDGQADAHPRHHPDGAGLRRHQRAPQEKGRRAERRPWRQGQYEVGVPVVHPRLPRDVHSVQRRRHPRRSRRDAQEHQQVPDGRGARRHRPQYELRGAAAGNPAQSRCSTASSSRCWSFLWPLRSKYVLGIAPSGTLI